MRRSIVIIVLLFSSACGNLSPCPDNSCQQPPRGKGLSEAHKVYYTATRKDGVGVLAALPRKDYNTWQLVDGMAWFVVDSNPVVYFDGVAELIDFSASLTGDERYVYRYTETTGFCRGASYVMMADRLDLAGKLEIRIRALSDECPTDLEEAIDCEALRARNRAYPIATGNGARLPQSATSCSQRSDLHAQQRDAELGPPR